MNKSRVKEQVKIQVEGMAKSRHESADSRKLGRVKLTIEAGLNR
jgi:hypothetical protein